MSDLHSDVMQSIRNKRNVNRLYINHNRRWWHWPLVLMCKLYRIDSFHLDDKPDYIVNVYRKEL